MSTIGSFDLCRLCESARVSVVRCWSQNLTCFCSCCRLPPAHTALKHTLLQPDETNESSEPLPPAYKCSFSQSVFSSVHTHTRTLVLSPTHILSHLWLHLLECFVCVLCKGAHVSKCQKPTFELFELFTPGIIISNAFPVTSWFDFPSFVLEQIFHHKAKKAPKLFKKKLVANIFKLFGCASRVLHMCFTCILMSVRQSLVHVNVLIQMCLLDGNFLLKPHILGNVHRRLF